MQYKCKIMSESVVAVISTPPEEGQPRMKQSGSINFVENWPKGRDLSKWYFYTTGRQMISLKIGWNLFGRHSSNNIQIDEPRMQSCEFLVFILDNFSFPYVYSVNGNCMLNGLRIKENPDILRHRNTIAVPVEKIVILFQFLHLDFDV